MSDTRPYFIGEFIRTLDRRNRISLPADFRSELTDSKLGLKGRLEKPAITILPLTDHFQHAVGKETAQTAAPFMYKSYLDGEGRLYIHPHLLDNLSLDHTRCAHSPRKVAIIGVIDRMEIWTTSQWQEERAERLQHLGPIYG